VKIVDLNLLLYASDRRAKEHEGARKWWGSVLNGTETVALAWVVVLGFVRLTTRLAVLANPLTPAQALDVVDGWLTRPHVVVVQPGRRHATVLRQLLEHVGTGGNLVPDAHLAALALEHGAELCSHDADFSRFPGVRWVDPLR
jgi:uncharacterized protein